MESSSSLLLAWVVRFWFKSLQSLTTYAQPHKQGEPISSCCEECENVLSVSLSCCMFEAVIYCCVNALQLVILNH